MTKTREPRRYKTGDVVRARGSVFGRVEGWHGDLVSVRIIEAPINDRRQYAVGTIEVFTPDELTLVRTAEEYWE